MPDLTDKQKRWIDDMIKRSGLNDYGDPQGTNYMGGTPLFDERTGQQKDRYTYILSRHRDWIPQEN